MRDPQANGVDTVTLNSDPLVYGIIVQVSVCRIHKQMVLIQ